MLDSDSIKTLRQYQDEYIMTMNGITNILEKELTDRKNYQLLITI